MTDAVTPLCTWAQFTSGAFANLAKNYQDPSAQTALLEEATRMCERAAGRRLAPFSGMTESHRLQGVDPDEYPGTDSIPMDMAGTLGMSYANALNTTDLVRHCWLRENAPHYPEFWTYDISVLEIFRSFGGSQVLTAPQYTGPEPDSGHVWFQLGLFIPIASYARITYSGGYTLGTPADLRRACKNITAVLLINELQPAQRSHDPALLQEQADAICGDYGRD